MNTYSLVADVGGTNTRVALAHGTQIIERTIVKHRNKDHTGLEQLLAHYLQTQGQPDCSGAAVAIAGPVKDGAGQLTNLNWKLDKTALSDLSQTDNVAVLNDLQAQGHALGHIAEDDLIEVKGGAPASVGAAMLVVGIGTGFNCAPVFQTAKGRLVPPSEAGHATLPAYGPTLCDLSDFLAERLGHAAIEDVLSGRGLENCYRWASARAGQPSDITSAEIFAAAEAGNDIALTALRAFVLVMGGVIGDLSLTLLPFGGIYLIGGMSRAAAPWFKQLGFNDALTAKGRFNTFVDKFPIHIITDDYAALCGCAHFLASSGRQTSERS